MPPPRQPGCHTYSPKLRPVALRPPVSLGLPFSGEACCYYIYILTHRPSRNERTLHQDKILGVLTGDGIHPNALPQLEVCPWRRDVDDTYRYRHTSGLVRRHSAYDHSTEGAYPATIIHSHSQCQRVAPRSATDRTVNPERLRDRNKLAQDLLDLS